ncbi:MAG: FKBP-type peptidyl-prolyl cis-trans isomerase [Bacteroidales bacterium]|jgi:FKBP-type peptidyl-prolyl cis-trans isomerase|nr:FKBP-type peptidyl-prolyl cis-trans isomerase [Bacteroidales bacterium]
MRTLTKISVAALIALAAFSCGKKSKQSNVALNDLRDSASYIIGVNFRSQISQTFPDSVNLDVLIAGLRDAATNAVDTPRIAMSDMQRIIEAYYTAQLRLKFKQNIEDGEKFLAENAKRPGVITTASGLQYEVITMGKGDKPGPYDKVTFHYHGTKVDGTVFDSSKGADAVTLTPSQVVPGFGEGLQLFPAGSKFKLFVPENLGYGANGPRGDALQPFETLIFEVEIISIEKGEAPQMPQFDMSQLMQQQ